MNFFKNLLAHVVVCLFFDKYGDEIRLKSGVKVFLVFVFIVLVLLSMNPGRG
jgi:hypothetical protein